VPCLVMVVFIGPNIGLKDRGYITENYFPGPWIFYINVPWGIIIVCPVFAYHCLERGRLVKNRSLVKSAIGLGIFFLANWC